MKKIRTYREAKAIFDLLGIKEVTKPWQKEKGTQVFELPFKTMYANGHKEINRFSIYKSGYVRKMLVNSKGASWCCYQLNKVRKKEYFVKDYEFIGDTYKTKWTGKYRKQHSNERIMIDFAADRMVYLCNYILKNYYRKQSGASFYRIYDYQVDIIKQLAKEDKARYDDKLPFFDADEGEWKNSPNVDDVKVIINGQRYNLS